MSKAAAITHTYFPLLPDRLRHYQPASRLETRSRSKEVREVAPAVIYKC